MEKIRDDKALLKINSHRAREKLERLLGYLPQCYFSFYRKGEFREVTLKELGLVKDAKIKGITQSHWSDDLLKSWSWN